MLTSYSLKGQKKPEEIAEKYSQVWCETKLAEIRRWAHKEKVPLKAWKREIAFINEIIHAIRIGHPAPRMLAGYATMSLSENFPRASLEEIVDVVPVTQDAEAEVAANDSEQD